MEPSLTTSLRDTPTPVPYKEGKQLELQILESHHDDLPVSQPVTATIHALLSMTMSPVLDVIIQTRNGSPFHAVLKLYDRRFGEDLRRVYKQSGLHTSAREAAFHAFIRQGKMTPFLREVDEAHETELIPPSPAGFLEDGAEGPAKYEAAQWRGCREYFRCETKAYAQLSDLQGTLIPRMLAHVRLVSGGDLDVPHDLRETAAPYFALKGVLLEHIDGYKLEDITSLLRTSPPKNLKEWQAIIQAAANAAHVINERGILMEDASPRNVMVDQRLQTPRIIDFAQCLFRDELVDQWHRWEWEEDEAWDPDVEYWERAGQQEDPVAIGVVAGNRVQKATGVKLDFTYPDYTKIISDVRRSKAEAEGTLLGTVEAK